MATSTIDNRLKEAFDHLGIPLTKSDLEGFYTFEYEHFPLEVLLAEDDGETFYTFVFDVIDANGNLNEAVFGDALDIVTDQHPDTDGDWNDGNPVLVSHEHLINDEENVDPETLAAQLKDFHEAILFLQGNLFIMTDDMFKEFQD